jgi:rhodanese-related sulfurtransferase
MIDGLRAIAMTGIKRSIRRRFADVQTVSTQTLKRWLDQNPNSVILWDARSPEEYAVSHLPNAGLAPLTLAEVKSKDTAQLEQLGSTPIVVYCSVGYRSARLIHRIQKLKQVQMYNLEGSLFEWVNRGYPVYQGMEQTHSVHPYNSRWGRLLNSDVARCKTFPFR